MLTGTPAICTRLRHVPSRSVTFRHAHRAPAVAVPWRGTLSGSTPRSDTKLCQTPAIVVRVSTELPQSSSGWFLPSGGATTRAAPRRDSLRRQEVFPGTFCRALTLTALQALASAPRPSAREPVQVRVPLKERKQFRVRCHPGWRQTSTSHPTEKKGICAAMPPQRGYSQAPADPHTLQNVPCPAGSRDRHSAPAPRGRFLHRAPAIVARLSTAPPPPGPAGPTEPARGLHPAPALRAQRPCWAPAIVAFGCFSPTATRLLAARQGKSEGGACRACGEAKATEARASR